jgi:hypothetical protein
VNTAEVIGGEACGTVAFLGLAIGYPWLVLSYAHLGVLKLGRPPQARAKPDTTISVAPGAGESPVPGATVKTITRETAA